MKSEGNTDTYYLLLKQLEQNPEITQRELAASLGLSLGKTNYCLKALIKKGWLKAENFKNSKKKISYFYVLTPDGIRQKAVINLNFLKRKEAEYMNLKKEIEELRREILGRDV